MFNPKVLEVCQILLSSLTHVSICNHIHCVAYTLDSFQDTVEMHGDSDHKMPRVSDRQYRFGKSRFPLHCQVVRFGTWLTRAQLWSRTCVFAGVCLCAPWPESGSLIAHRSVCQSIWCVATIRNNVRRSISGLTDVRCAQLAQVGFRTTCCALRSSYSFYCDPETPAAANTICLCSQQCKCA